VRECCKGDDQSQWRRANFDPQAATLKPRNRSSSKCAQVIMSGIPTTLQSFIQIASGVSFPCMRDFAHQIVYSAIFGVLHPAHSQDATAVVDTKYAKRRGSAQGCVFSELQTQKLTFTPHFFPKPPFWDPISTVFRNFRPKNSFYIGSAKSKRPLNVIIAP